MKEYLVNVGEFNVIVLPDAKQYFILGDDEGSADVERRFVHGEEIAYRNLSPLWFQYGQEESWKDFDDKPYRLGQDVTEDDLISMYVLKKFNFGSLVAVREKEGGKARVFKRDMLKK